MTVLSKNILFEHFAGRTTPLQKKIIAQWLENEENKIQYYKWLEEFENEFPQMVGNVEKAKSVFLKQIHQTENHNEIEKQNFQDIKNRPNKTVFNIKKWSVAAITVFTLGSILYLNKNNIIYKNHKTDFGETKNILLEDGSTVVLNANSRLKYKRFSFENEPIREVFLDGEAAFSVKHTNNNQKFVVSTEHNLEVEVLGTEFTVFTRNRGSKVILTKGKVKVNYLNESKPTSTIMKPGDLLSINKKGKSEKKEVKNIETLTAWKTKQFVFDNTSIEEISYLLEENYGTKLKIQTAELANRTITGTFSADKAEDFVTILEQLLEANIIKSDNDTLLLTEN